MPDTVTYAKVGTTTWRCAIYFDNGEETYAEYHEQAEYPNKGLAKAWMNRTLPTHWNPRDDRPGQFWGQIERGTYVNESFDHDGEHIRNASWELDERPGSQAFADLAGNGVDVDWSED